jgi:hypothetical protein
MSTTVAKAKRVLCRLVSTSPYPIPGLMPRSRFSLVPDEANNPRPAPPQPPASDNTPAADDTQTSQNAPGVLGPISNILQRLWGQSGAVPPSAAAADPGNTRASEPSSPQVESPETQTQRVYDPPTGPPPTRDPPSPRLPAHESATSLAHDSQEVQSRTYDPPSGPPPMRRQFPTSPPSLAPEVSTPTAETHPNSIPDDYRARHRQREQEQREQNP